MDFISYGREGFSVIKDWHEIFSHVRTSSIDHAITSGFFSNNPIIFIFISAYGSTFDY